MQISKMIVHPGPVHRDDLLCMALVAFELGCTILRREPTKEELADANVLVVDVGMRHEPKLNNYDHHQLGRDADPEWAFGLMLRGLFPEVVAQAFEACNWFSTSRLMDSKGPFAVAAAMELPTTWTQELWSPIEEAITDIIEKMAEIPTDSPIYQMLDHLGTHLHDNALTWYRALTELGEQVKVREVKGVQVLLVEKVLNGIEELAIAKIQRDRLPEAGAMVSFDNRGEGMTFYRFLDHPKVDFAKLLDLGPKMEFVHPGGFIAKTKSRLDESEVISFLEKSIQ